MNRFLSKGLAFLLALLMAMIMPMQVMAESSEIIYIGEVSVGSYEKLVAGGYTVIPDNLNEGGTPQYLGYKTTKDPNKAITTISSLGMYGGYTAMSYRELMLNNSAGIQELGKKLQTAVTEFKNNYNTNNAYAMLAYEVLNALYMPIAATENEEAKAIPLGEYLLDSTRTLADFQTLAMMCSNIVMSYILNQLSYGVSEDVPNGAESWLDRLVQNGPLVFVDETTGEKLSEAEIEDIYTSRYDPLYAQRASCLYASIHDFITRYEEAQARIGGLNNYVIPSEEEADQLVEDLTSAIFNGDEIAFDDETGTSELLGKENVDVLPMVLFEKLNSQDESGKYVYPYGENEDGSPRSLAQYLYKIGKMEEGEDAYRLLYPFIAEKEGVAPLTNGQEVIFYLSGISNLLMLACGDEESFKNAKEETQSSIGQLLSLNGGERVSVYYDVNVDFYNEALEGVYWTDSLAREAAAHGRYELLTKPVDNSGLSVQAVLNNALIYTGCLVVAAMGAAMVTSLILGAAVGVKGLGAMISVAVAYITSQAVTYSTAACLGCVFGAACLTIVAIAVVALIIIALIKLFIWIFDDDDEPDLVLTEIPQVLYDYNNRGEGSAVIYQVVRNVETQKAANLNDGLRNIPWVALYTTTDRTMGQPITVTMLNGEVTESPVVFKKGDQTVPQGYAPLTAIESITAGNLNEGRSGVAGLFGFIHRAQLEQEDHGSKYIMDVIMVSENTEEAARAKIIDAGYNLIDSNLTSDSGVATYIGYMTTDDENNAVRDLRIAYSTGMDPKEASISYGGATYGCCGYVGNLLLMQSKWACSGSPILAENLVVTNQLGNAPYGYEPVNLFCGGPAFDINNCNGWNMTDENTGKEYISKWGSHSYIYFNPSVKFTSGPLYLGGLAFFSGSTNNYMSESGWKKMNNMNLNNNYSDDQIAYDVSGPQDGETYLCYTTTYNPYRAIYDIKYYQASALSQGVPYTMTIGDMRYAVCDVFQQGGGGVGYNRMVRPTHSFRSNLWYEGGCSFDPEHYLSLATEVESFHAQNAYAEFYEMNGNVIACNLKCAALYVAGNLETDISKAQPIQIDQIHMSASPNYDSNTSTPLRSIEDAYATKGANLAFNDYYRTGNSFYIFIDVPDQNATKPLYIESVTVVTKKGYDLDNKEGSKQPYDDALLTLVSAGEGTLLDLTMNNAPDYLSFISIYEHEYELSNSQDGATRIQKVRCFNHNTNYEVSMVYVTYTNAKTSGISDIVIFQPSGDVMTDAEANSIIKSADGYVTEACGDGFRMNTRDMQYYYLRAVRNAGNQITDLVIDKNVMLRNYWTSISTTGAVSNYNLYYVKTKHAQKANLNYYISNIISASGNTETEAMLALLEKGCRFYCPFNLNPDGKDGALYIGYTVSTSYRNGFSGILLYDAGQDSTVTKIVKGRDSYTRVVDTLNLATYDSIIGMYVTKSSRKACENGATTASKGHYITDIMFYTDTDLNDYATGVKSLDELDSVTRAYVESYIYDAEGNIVYWDIVTDADYEIVNCNLAALSNGQIDTNAGEVYMYVHYSDNATPVNNSLSGSIFGGNTYALMAIISGTILVVIGAVYLVLQLRRKKETEKVDQNA